MGLTIGCSLPPHYVAGGADAEWDALFPTAHDCLSSLREAGVEQIELRAISPTTSPQLVAEAVQELDAHGLSHTIHASLPTRGKEKIAQFLEPLSELSADRDLLLVVHAYADETEQVSELANATADVLTTLVDHSQPRIRFALELSRSKGPNDPSTTYAGLLRMVKAVDSSRVGIAWDFGHTAANLVNGHLHGNPPAEFLGRVIHTHIHDLSETGKTHFPLTEGRMPLGTFASLLIRAGYVGCLHLELDPRRWSWPAAEKRVAVFESVSALQIQATLRKHVLNKGQ